MVDSHYSLICTVCLINLAIIIFQHIKYYHKSEYKRNFVILSVSCFVFILVDLLWGLIASDILHAQKYFFLVTTIYHLCTAIVSFNFAFFIFYFNKGNFKKLKLIAVLSFGPLAAVAGLLIYNWITEKIFYIDENGLYSRGNIKLVNLIYFLLFLYFIISFFISIYSYVVSADKKQKFSRAVIFFSVLPVISGILQRINPWLPYFSIGFACSCILVYSFENSLVHSEMVKSSINDRMGKVIDECSLILQAGNIPEKNVEKMLNLVGEYYDADEVYFDVFEKNSFIIEKSYGWHAEKYLWNSKKELEKIPKKVIADWVEIFSTEKEVYIPDTQADDVKKTYSDFAKNSHIKSSMILPILFDDKVKAVVYMHNMKKSENDFSVIRTISFFVLSEVLKLKSMKSADVERQSIISALSDGYDCIYYINLDEDKITLYRHDDKVVRFLDIRDNETVPFNSSYKVYVENVVIPEDQEEVLEFGSVEVLKNMLRNRKSVSKRFRANLDGKNEFFEAKWVKVENEDEEPKFIVLGYANIEEKVQEQKFEEQERELVQAQLTSAIETAEAATLESQIDKLTGIYNKSAGLDIMNKFLNAKPEDEQYGLIFFDLDKFKEINDNHGHLEGDQILKGVGKAIRSKCRAGDIAVRFGGDEFIILIKKVSEVEQVERKAQLISDEIKKLSQGKFYYTNCSIGGYITSSRELQHAMDEADHALYYVKQHGRDGVKVLKDNK